MVGLIQNILHQYLRHKKRGCSYRQIRCHEDVESPLLVCADNLIENRYILKNKNRQVKRRFTLGYNSIDTADTNTISTLPKTKH